MKKKVNVGIVIKYRVYMCLRVRVCFLSIIKEIWSLNINVALTHSTIHKTDLIKYGFISFLY